MQWISTKERLPDSTQIVIVTLRRFLWDDDICSGEYEDLVCAALFDKRYQAYEPFEVPYIVFKDGDLWDGVLTYGYQKKQLQTGYVNKEPIYADGPDDYVIAWAPLPEAYTAQKD